ncbi:MAG: Hsp70 family protein, partial [bacterium]|nr:Hsp70 family protein [bacterium]
CTTARDDQAAVEIRGRQGESESALESDLLGEFVLSGIRPAPKGEPEIEVSFDIDANGIVSASARDMATGKEQSITVNATGTLSDEEISQIIEENELYEVELKG